MQTSGDPRFLTSQSEGVGERDAVRAQVDRILASDTFRSADVLRRLLRFLADKTFSGEADHLKEYSVGLDALGKPSSFNPSKDSVVRLQASRLRQKLNIYYETEGRDDSTVIELPKGRFKIAWHTKNHNEAAPPSVAPRRNVLIIGVAAVVSLLLGFITYRSVTRASSPVPVAGVMDRLTPELKELWSPFLSSTRHLIIGFSNPFFVRLQEGGSRDTIYHTMGVNSWEDAEASSELPALRRALGNAKATPTYNMVERSTLVATFVLSRFLAGRLSDISLVRSNEVSWQQLADNDVILLGRLLLYQQGSSLPVEPAFVLDTAGVRNLQPLAGEPAVFPDPQDHQESDGQGLELVSMLPGPLGRTNILSFSSNHAWGVICGVQALADPSFVHVLTNKLRTRSGKLPAYYQVVLKISYRDGIPTTASYVAHRALELK